MAIADRIHQFVQRLPEPLQTEVLDFARFLLYRLERESTEAGRDDWAALSLSMAMRGMEDEDSLYTTDDLK